MTSITVHKFGGTSVGDAERITSAARIIAARAAASRPVVVSSAMTGVTNALIAAMDLAARGDAAATDEAAGALTARHVEAAAALELDGDLRSSFDRTLDTLRTTLAACSALGEVSARQRDAVLATGEKLAVRLVAAALRAQGLRAEAVDADTFIETDGRHGEATPLHGLAERTTAMALRPLIDEGVVPVVTGFCGQGPDGATTTLGRGGSDYSATFVGAALRAEQVVIWTDVNGVFTTDPRVVRGARLLEQLNYREAAELSFYGAKVLHPRTIQPVSADGIPVVIANSFDPDGARTVVDGRMTIGSHPVKALSAIRGQALVSVEGRGMAGVPGVSRRLFGALARAGISVTMISQSSSESSICVAISGSDASQAELAVKREFRLDISHGDVEDVVMRPNVGLVAAVGLGMAHVPGVAGRVCTALGDAGVNLLAVAQGSSELNISLAVDGAQVDDAIRAIHQAFGLHQRDTGEENSDGFQLALFGLGNVGRRVATLIHERADAIRERFGLRPQLVAIADSSGWVFSPRGLTSAEVNTIVEAKAAGTRVGEMAGATPADDDPAGYAREVLQYRFARPVLVDVSGWEGSAAVFREALERGADVVTANKWPLASAPETFDELMATSERTGRLLRAEATVGAGLPVVDTIEMLNATGDRIHRVEGCLSGTLAFVLSQMNDGRRFSEAVAEAQERGYTEPDPVLDLAGTDVLRKAIIIARLAGLPVDVQAARAEGLVPDSLRGMARDALYDALRERDDEMAQRVAAAKAAGGVLRYVARVAAGEIFVGPAVVTAESPLFALSGTDNMIVVHSERYADRPLAVTGPGAGIDVTAMGVLADVLRIVAERS